jgi:hypothetical protein
MAEVVPCDCPCGYCPCDCGDRRPSTDAVASAAPALPFATVTVGRSFRWNVNERDRTGPASLKAEGVGLEPTRACAQRLSRPRRTLPLDTNRRTPAWSLRSASDRVTFEPDLS